MDLKKKILTYHLDKDGICHGDNYIDDYGVHDTIYEAMEEYSNLRIIEVLEKLYNVAYAGDSYDVIEQIDFEIKQLKSQLPQSIEDSKNDIPDTVGGGYSK